MHLIRAPFGRGSSVASLDLQRSDLEWLKLTLAISVEPSSNNNNSLFYACCLRHPTHYYPPDPSCSPTIAPDFVPSPIRRGDKRTFRSPSQCLHIRSDAGLASAKLVYHVAPVRFVAIATSRAGIASNVTLLVLTVVRRQLNLNRRSFQILPFQLPPPLCLHLNFLRVQPIYLLVETMPPFPPTAQSRPRMMLCRKP